MTIMATTKKRAKQTAAGWTWCITRARDSLIKAGRHYNFDQRQYRRYMANHLAPFEASAARRTKLLKEVRRYRDKHPDLLLTYWQTASSMMFDAVWEGYWWKLSYPDSASGLT